MTTQGFWNKGDAITSEDLNRMLWHFSARNRFPNGKQNQIAVATNENNALYVSDSTGRWTQTLVSPQWHYGPLSQRSNSLPAGSFYITNNSPATLYYKTGDTSWVGIGLRSAPDLLGTRWDFGVISERPNAQTEGRIYVATDQNNRVYRDDGSSWSRISLDLGALGTTWDFGTFSARPSTTRTGNIYVATDRDNTVYRYTGSSWTLVDFGTTTVSNTGPTEAQVYAHVKSILVAGTNTGITAADTRNRLTLTANQAQVSRSGLYNTLKDVLRTNRGITITEDDSSSTLTIDASSAGSKVVTRIYTSSGTWHKPDKLSSLDVEAIGGGGAGGWIINYVPSVQNNIPAGNYYGGGGGSGGRTVSSMRAATITQRDVSFTIGAGGTRGGRGFATSFGPYVRVTGGEPGSTPSRGPGSGAGGRGGRPGGVTGGIGASGSSGGLGARPYGYGRGGNGAQARVSTTHRPRGISGGRPNIDRDLLTNIRLEEAGSPGVIILTEYYE